MNTQLIKWWSYEGDLYACGNNENNKLGLNDQNGWVFSGEVKHALVPTRIKAVKQKIIAIVGWNNLSTLWIYSCMRESHPASRAENFCHPLLS